MLIFSSSSYFSYYLVFKINQKYIAKNLCVERENPENTCNGCCQLNKVLDEEDNENTKSEEINFPEFSSSAILNSRNSEIDLFHNSVKFLKYYDDLEFMQFYKPITPPPKFI